MTIESIDADKLLGDLARHYTALHVATAAGDRLAMFVATARAQTIARTLCETFEAIDDREGVAAMAEALGRLRTKPGVPRFALASDHPRLQRWLTAPRTPREPDLFELRCGRAASLIGLRAPRLYIARSAFASAALHGACFDGARLEDCDFSGAALDRSSWVGARVVRCTLTACSLIDATLDGAQLVDCTLVRADLGASTLRPRPTALGAIFERCDLRESVWHQRILIGAKLDRCCVANVHGRPVVEGIEIVEPDFSAAGDGSRIGAPRDVFAND